MSFWRSPTSKNHAARSKRVGRLVVERLERRGLMTVTVSAFTLPTSDHPPAQLTTGPDGNLWFTEQALAGAIGEINPTTHAIVEIPIPTPDNLPLGITTGSDGNIWFTEQLSSKIGMVNPTTHAIEDFSIPGVEGPQAITSGPDGNLWLSDGGGIGVFNPTTHAFDQIAVPSGTGGIQDITTGPDGNVWFTALLGDSIGRITPTTHAVTIFPLPPSFNPVDITAAPDGNLWFTGEGLPLSPSGQAAAPGEIGMINPTTLAISEFSIRSGFPADGIAVGPDGNLWFTDYELPIFGPFTNLGMINLTTHAISDFSRPD